MSALRALRQHQLGLVCVVLGGSAVALSAQTTRPGPRAKAQTPRAGVDWFALVESIALPATVTYNVQAPAKLKGMPGVRWRFDRDGYFAYDTGGSAVGSALVTIEGKPLTVPGIPHPWVLRASIAGAGLMKLSISSDLNSQELMLNVKDDLAKRRVPFRSIRCNAPENGETTGGVLYEITPRGKQPTMLLHEWSCGAAGCSAVLTIFFGGGTPPPEETGGATANCG